MKWKFCFVFATILVFCQADLFAQPYTSLQETAKDTTLTKPDKLPAFPGGQQGWRTYLMSNIRYPAIARRANTQGTVKVRFVVDAEGKVSNVVALNNPGDGLMEEAVRVITSGPYWIPAQQNGHNVKCYHIQAITFRLQ